MSKYTELPHWTKGHILLTPLQLSLIFMMPLPQAAVRRLLTYCLTHGTICFKTAKQKTHKRLFHATQIVIKYVMAKRFFFFTKSNQQTDYKKIQYMGDNEYNMIRDKHSDLKYLHTFLDHTIG